jgi:hypothetical protein
MMIPSGKKLTNQTTFIMILILHHTEMVGIHSTIICFTISIKKTFKPKSLLLDLFFLITSNILLTWIRMGC